MPERSSSMKLSIVAAFLLIMPLVNVHANAAAPVRKLQKVMIINSAWDTARAAAVEAGIKSDLLHDGVMAESARTLTMGDKKPSNVQELTALIQGQGYESL